MPDDLIAFLTERLNEHERIAVAARGHVPVRETSNRNPRHVQPNRQIAQVMLGAFTVTITPERVLKDVEADRKLIATYWEAKAYYTARPGVDAGEVTGLYSAIEIRAERFDDHREYREGWRP